MLSLPPPPPPPKENGAHLVRPATYGTWRARLPPPRAHSTGRGPGRHGPRSAQVCVIIKNLADALMAPDWKGWIGAYRSELLSWLKNNVFCKVGPGCWEGEGVPLLTGGAGQL